MKTKNKNLKKEPKRLPILSFSIGITGESKVLMEILLSLICRGINPPADEGK
jgi:hypothetical protein